MDCVTSSLNRFASRKIKFQPSQLRNPDLQQNSYCLSETLCSVCVSPVSPLMGFASDSLVVALLPFLSLLPLYYVFLVPEKILQPINASAPHCTESLRSDISSSTAPLEEFDLKIHSVVSFQMTLKPSFIVFSLRNQSL